MALKIQVKAPDFPAKPVDLITPIQNPHRVKIYSLLKPWHPFFVFEVLTEDLNGVISFRIGIKELESKGKQTQREFPKAQVVGVFPWADCPGEPADKYGRFQLYVFECMTHLVDRFIGQTTWTHRQMLQLVTGGTVNWTRVCKWFELLTDPISPWFDRGTTVENGQLHFILTQTQALKGGEPVCGWWFMGKSGPEAYHPVLPIDVANLNTSAIDKEVAQLGDQAEATLHRHLLDQATNALYYMGFRL